MTRKTIILLTLSLVVIIACKKVASIPDTSKKLVLTTTEQQKVAADNAFTLKLFKATLSENGDNNLFLSPLSVSMAVGMTSNGAAGQTLHDIRNTMNFNNFTEDQVNNYYHKMITELPQLDSKTTLKFANSIWYAKGFTPLSTFLQTNETNYNARIESVDFKNAGTKDVINSWVSNATDGKIATIIDKSTDDAILYLINAIYFKSSWANKFDPAKTQKGTFYLPAGTVQADFMNLTYAPLNTNITSDARVLELPYNNKEFSMVIITPTAKSVQEYAAGLDSAKWQSLIGGLSGSFVNVSMPKFKFSYNTELRGALSTLGMANAFSNVADFSRLSAGGLAISEVKHKAYIEVDEEGTTAAAVTSVTVVATAVLPYNFKLDHPFIFAIREMKSGLVLFAGVVNDPTK